MYRYIQRNSLKIVLSKVIICHNQYVIMLSNSICPSSISFIIQVFPPYTDQYFTYKKINRKLKNLKCLFLR